MKKGFDNLISDAAPEVPDCGPSRRMARLLLHDRMRRVEQRKRTWYRPSAAVAAGLTLLLLMARSTGDLGSDSFDMTELGPVIDVRGTDGYQVRSMKIGLGGESNYMPVGSTEDDAREMHLQRELDQGELVGVMATEVFGQVRWLVDIVRVVNGREFHVSRAPEGYPEKSPPGHKQFISTHVADLIGRVRNDDPVGKFVREFNGVWFEIGYWTYEYPEFGFVTYYEGEPLQ